MDHVHLTDSLMGRHSSSTIVDRCSQNIHWCFDRYNVDMGDLKGMNDMDDLDDLDDMDQHGHGLFYTGSRDFFSLALDDRQTMVEIHEYVFVDNLRAMAMAKHYKISPSEEI